MVRQGPQAIDYAVMPLAGLWRAEEMATFTTNDRAQWQWTMISMPPPFVAPELVQTAITAV